MNSFIGEQRILESKNVKIIHQKISDKLITIQNYLRLFAS